jgi:hypothetical protein
MKARFKMDPYYTGTCLGGPRESMKTPINIVGVQIEIRTEYLP